MKLKEKQQLRKTSVPELEKDVQDLKEQLKKLKIDRFTKEMKNSRAARNLKKNIAVRKTYSKEQQVA